MFSNRSRILFVLSFCAVSILAAGLFVSEAQGQMKKPSMVTVRGTLIDLTCASKGKAMMNNWHNAQSNDHMTPDGEQKACATMCLKGGQPAALFDKGKITAVLACNPQATLAAYAAESVEISGFWAGDGKDVKSLVPAKIRSGGGDWQEVDCATMHN